MNPGVTWTNRAQHFKTICLPTGSSHIKNPGPKLTAQTMINVQRHISLTLLKTNCTSRCRTLSSKSKKIGPTAIAQQIIDVMLRKKRRRKQTPSKEHETNNTIMMKQNKLIQYKHATQHESHCTKKHTHDATESQETCNTTTNDNKQNARNAELT
jgi:hypothetical protein